MHRFMTALVGLIGCASRKPWGKWAIFLAAALAFGGAARGSVIVTLEQVGSNVVASGSGTIDLSGIASFDEGPSPGSVATIYPVIEGFQLGNATTVEVYGGISNPVGVGSGGYTDASSFSGDGFGAAGNTLAVPVGYISGTELSGTATWDNATFASLGVNPGVYTWKWGSGADADSITLYAGVSPTPEPASLLLIALGLIAVLAMRALLGRQSPTYFSVLCPPILQCKRSTCVFIRRLWSFMFLQGTGRRGEPTLANTAS